MTSIPPPIWVVSSGLSQAYGPSAVSVYPCALPDAIISANVAPSNRQTIDRVPSRSKLHRWGS